MHCVYTEQHKERTEEEDETDDERCILHLLKEVEKRTCDIPEEEKQKQGHQDCDTSLNGATRNTSIEHDAPYDADQHREDGQAR